MIDSFTRHQIYLGRYAGGLYKEALPELKKMRDDISSILLANNISELRSKRLRVQLAEIKLIIDTTINGSINNKLFEDLAIYESEYSLRVLDKATPASVVISTGVNAAVLLPQIEKSKLLLQGMKKPQTIEQVIKTFSDAHYKDIESEIRRGISEGLTNNDIVKKVQYLSNNRTRNQAEAVVRTITNHVSTTARTETFKEYDNLFQGERFSSVLDSRVTLQCAVRDGGIWTFDGKPVNAIARRNEYRRPALHYNCRSLLIPELKPEYDLDIKTTRASKFGQVDSKLTYGEWLKKQPESFQIDALGKERAKLFRDGNLSLQKFVDRSGEVLNLEQLKAKEL